MKRFFLLLSILLLTGCVSIYKSDYDTIIDDVVSSKSTIYNTYRKGYKFYLPKGMQIQDSTEYNEIITSGGNTYYLYIDVISYLEKREDIYKKRVDNVVYDRSISSDKKSGYLEIINRDDKYLVEIIYNYAKIEVIVREEDLKGAVANAMVVLSSIYYNDNVLSNVSRENVLSYNEENIDIFNTEGKEESHFLTYDPSIYEDEDTEIPDYDLIK